MIYIMYEPHEYVLQGNFNQSIGAEIGLLASHARLLANDEHLRSRFPLQRFSLSPSSYYVYLLLVLLLSIGALASFVRSCAYEDYELA